MVKRLGSKSKTVKIRKKTITGKKPTAKKTSLENKISTSSAILNSKKAPLDPDRLSLSKKDIILFCDRVLERWQKEKNPTMGKNIAAMMAVKMAVYFTDEESLKAIWSEIVKWVYQLLYENAMAQGKEENSVWASTLAKLKK